MSRKLLDDCFLHDKDRLRHLEVLTILKERLSCVAAVETVPLDGLHGRVLAEDLVTRLSIPPRDNAAVDGYAFEHAAYTGGGQLPVTQRIAAGDPADRPLESGTAVRIFTGAFLPHGADTVAMQEDCEKIGGAVEIPPGLKQGANRRRAGEDIRSQTLLASAGDRLGASDLAAIAGQGLTQADCFRPLRIGVFSSGDEIVPPGEPLRTGQIYDTNRSLIAALLAHWPGNLTDLGRLPDQRDAVHIALADSAPEFDIIVTSGGASRGEEDHIVEVLGELGKRHLWQLAIKPGRPLTMGQIGDTLVFGLPGNPVAVFVCALLYLRPALFLLQGAHWPEPEGYRLPSAFSMRSKPDRREFLRGIPVVEDGVIIAVDKYARDGSGLISGLRASGGLIEIPEDMTDVAVGDLVMYRPYSGFGLI